MANVASNHELVIRPTRGWSHLDLAEIWRYRDLLYLLVHRELVVKYKQTILGPAWFVLQPLLMTVVFAVIFGNVAKIPTDGLPPMLFYSGGLLGWNFFAQTFQGTSSTLVANASLFGKVYFPRLVVPLAAVISSLLAFAIQLLTFLSLFAYFKIFTSTSSSFGLSRDIVLLAPLLVQIAALSLGVGLWLAALTAKYRDFTHLSSLFIQLWLYATPVIYPLSQIPARWRWVVLVNPMTAPVETMRHMFLGQGGATMSQSAFAVVTTLILLLSGVLVFTKVERTFVDRA